MYTVMGVITGIILGLLICFIIFKVCNKNGKMKTEYDERQEAIRGRGFKYAAYTAWILIGIYVVLGVCDISFPVRNHVVVFTIFIISLLVQVSHAILNDSYFGSNNKIKSYIVSFAIITLINGGCTVAAALDHRLIIDGVLETPAINGELAIAFLIIGIVYIIKKVVKKEDAEEE